MTLRTSMRNVNIEAPLNNKRIKVFIKQKYGSGDLTPATNLFPGEALYPGMQAKTLEHVLFCGTIDSSLRQKNRGVKEIIAYDDFYLMSQIKCYIGIDKKDYSSRIKDICIICPFIV